MPRPINADKLRVVVDARLVSGQAGGVESVIAGLASGLSSLEGPEEYVFAVGNGHADWLRPYVSGPTQLQAVEWEPVARGRIASALSRGGRIGRRLGASLPPPNVDYDSLVPRIDPAIEALGPTVLHLVRQRGVRSSAPTIYHPHDLQHVHLPEFFSASERSWRERVYGTLCREAELVAVASEWTRNDVVHHFDLPREKVQVVQLAPPLQAERPPTRAEREAVRETYALPAAYLLYPAQTWPHKNHARLLEALATLRANGLNVPLVATGAQNAHFSILAEMSRTLGIAEQVTWTGFVPPRDLAAIYAEARAVVVPSLFEAASAPLWEAFLAGVPAACSNVTSLPDQAASAALLFDPVNVDAIAASVAAVWTDEGLRNRLVTAGRERLTGLSWGRTARTFRAHYRRIAGRLLSDEDRQLAAIAA